MGFNCLKATVAVYFLLLSSQKFLVYTHFIDLRRMKGWVNLGFKRKTPGLGIQCLTHYAIVYSNPICHQHIYLVTHSFVFS